MVNKEETKQYDPYASDKISILPHKPGINKYDPYAISNQPYSTDIKYLQSRNYKPYN